MPPSLVKPARWAVTPALLEVAGKNLSRGLTDLLPFWDDGPTDLAHDTMSGTQYGWEEVTDTTTWVSKREPTSHGIGWQNTLYTDNNYLRTDRALTVGTDWIADWSEMYVVRLDTAVADSGLRSWGTEGDLLWFDYDGVAMRMGITTGPAGSANVYYGSTFHTAADNGTVYVVVVTNDDTNTQLKILVDGVVHISQADNVASLTDQQLQICQRNTDAMVGAMVSYARWNRVLTDTEVQQVSDDPFVLLRRDWAIPTATATTAATGSISPSGAAISLTPGTVTITPPPSAITLSGANITATPGSMTITTTVPVSPASAAISLTLGTLSLSTTVGITLASAAISVTPGTLAATDAGLITLDGATISVNAGSVSFGGTSGALGLHQDALYLWLQQNRTVASKEVVGALNELNSTWDVEYWKSRNTFLGL